MFRYLQSRNALLANFAFMDASRHPRPPSIADYRALSEFRYQIRRFLRFSEDAARGAEIEPQQHQVLLAIRGLPAGQRPTIKTLAERMCVQHHTTVALVDHLEAKDFVRREPSERDRREVLVVITAQGDRLLRRLSRTHHEQLQTVGPTLVAALTALLSFEEDKAAKFPP
jgi:DNA-binding MarR family transcriptional regulator